MEQLEEVKNIWIRVQLEYKSIVNMGPYTVDCHLRLGRQQNHHLDILYKTEEKKKKKKTNILLSNMEVEKI